MSVKASVSISEQQDAFARALVEDGRYASVSAVVQRGLELLRSETEREAAELVALKAFFEERRDGAFEDGASARISTRTMLEAKRRDLGL